MFQTLVLYQKEENKENGKRWLKDKKKNMWSVCVRLKSLCLFAFCLLIRISYGNSYFKLLSAAERWKATLSILEVWLLSTVFWCGFQPSILAYHGIYDTKSKKKLFKISDSAKSWFVWYVIKHFSSLQFLMFYWTNFLIRNLFLIFK